MLPPAIGDTPGVLAGKPPTPSTATPWEVTVACRRVTRRREVIARNTSVVNTEGMQCGKWRTQTSIVCIVVHGLHDDPEHDLDLDEGLRAAWPSNARKNHEGLAVALDTLRGHSPCLMRLSDGPQRT